MRYTLGGVGASNSPVRKNFFLPVRGDYQMISRDSFAALVLYWEQNLQPRNLRQFHITDITKSFFFSHFLNLIQCGLILTILSKSIIFLYFVHSHGSYSRSYSAVRSLCLLNMFYRRLFAQYLRDILMRYKYRQHVLDCILNHKAIQGTLSISQF